MYFTHTGNRKHKNVPAKCPQTRKQVLSPPQLPSLFLPLPQPPLKFYSGISLPDMLTLKSDSSQDINKGFVLKHQLQEKISR